MKIKYVNIPNRVMKKKTWNFWNLLNSITDVKNNTVIEFEEKNLLFENWINGGFFVVNSIIKSYISNLNQPFEGEPLKSLALEGELMAYKHHQLFRPVDTIHELKLLEEELSKNLF